PPRRAARLRRRAPVLRRPAFVVSGGPGGAAELPPRVSRHGLARRSARDPGLGATRQGRSDPPSAGILHPGLPGRGIHARAIRGAGSTRLSEGRRAAGQAVTVEVAGWADLLEGEELAQLGTEPPREPRPAPVPPELDLRV